MKNSPHISVITCTKDRPQYLDECFRSVVSQSFASYEHLIIDGESGNETLDIIKSYIKKNNKSRLISVKPRGISNAMNEGIKHAKGEYIIFLHSDDALYDREVLDKADKYLKTDNNLDWIYGQIEVVDTNGERVGIFPRYKILQLASKYLLKFINFVPHQAVFMKKQVFEEHGNFDETLKSSMDLDLWIRIANSTEWRYIPLLISKYRVHSDAQSSSKKNTLLNQKYYHLVKKRHLSPLELWISRIIDQLIAKTNKTVV